MNNKHRVISLIFFALILVIWEYVARSGLVSPLLLPSISDIYAAFIELATEGYREHTLLENVSISLYRVLVAFSLATLFGVTLGILSGINGYLRAILEPLINFLRPLPPLGYYFLLILWFGIDEESKIILLFLSALPPIFIASFRGINRIKKDYINSALSMGASRLQLFFFVLFPASLSDIFTGLRIAIGTCYATLVAAEMVAASSGLGRLVIDASSFNQTDILFVGVIMIGLTGLTLDRILAFVKNRIIHWEGKV